MVVLVTGGNGQLGQSLQVIAGKHPQITWVFCSSSELDITSTASLKNAFEQYRPHYCVNTAAYTAVDKSESEPVKARAINSVGPENLAKICTQFDTTLIHISTDFVFDGTQSTPYKESDHTHPLGIYGQTKWEGEQAVETFCAKYYIIRTAWVYSQFGANFMKTMLRLAGEREALQIVADQVGTPTNAIDLAEAIVAFTRFDVETTKPEYGIYHYSNEGQCSWYEFAKAIFKFKGITIPVHPIPTEQFPTPAKRPSYSVLDKTKIKSTLGITVPNWIESLQKTLQQ